MFPWGTVIYTTEEMAEVKRRLLRMHALWDMPLDVKETENGFVAMRDGKKGFGATRDEALVALWRQEGQERLRMPLIEKTEQL